MSNYGQPSTPSRARPAVPSRRHVRQQSSPEGGALVLHRAVRTDEEEILRLRKCLENMAHDMSNALKDAREVQKKLDEQIIIYKAKVEALEKQNQDLHRRLINLQQTTGFSYGFGTQPNFGGQSAYMTGGVVMGPYGMPMMMTGGMMPTMPHGLLPQQYQQSMATPGPAMSAATRPEEPFTGPPRYPLHAQMRSQQPSGGRSAKKDAKGKGKAAPTNNYGWSDDSDSDHHGDVFPAFNQKKADKAAVMSALDDQAMQKAMAKHTLAAAPVAGGSKVNNSSKRYDMPPIQAQNDHSMAAIQTQNQQLAVQRGGSNQIAFGLIAVDVEARDEFTNIITITYKFIQGWVNTYANEVLESDQKIIPHAGNVGEPELWTHLMSCVYKNPADAYAHLQLLLKEPESRSNLIVRAVVQFIFDNMWIEEVFYGFREKYDSRFQRVNDILHGPAPLKFHERVELYEHKARIVEDEIADPDYAAWREALANKFAKKIRSYLLPFLRPDAVKVDAGKDISMFIRYAMDVSTRMFTSRKNFAPIFPDCAQKFSNSSMISRTTGTKETGIQLQLRQARVKLAITPMITMREETIKGPTAVLLHVSNVLVMG